MPPDGNSDFVAGTILGASSTENPEQVPKIKLKKLKHPPLPRIHNPSLTSEVMQKLDSM